MPVLLYDITWQHHTLNNLSYLTLLHQIFHWIFLLADSLHPVAWEYKNFKNKTHKLQQVYNMAWRTITSMYSTNLYFSAQLLHSFILIQTEYKMTLNFKRKLQSHKMELVYTSTLIYDIMWQYFAELLQFHAREICGLPAVFNINIQKHNERYLKHK